MKQFLIVLSLVLVTLFLIRGSQGIDEFTNQVDEESVYASLSQTVDELIAKRLATLKLNPDLSCDIFDIP